MTQYIFCLPQADSSIINNEKVPLTENGTNERTAFIKCVGDVLKTSCEIFFTSGAKGLDIDEIGVGSNASSASLNHVQKSVAPRLLEAFCILPESKKGIQSEISTVFTNSFGAADTSETQFCYNNMLDASLSVDRSGKPDMASIIFHFFLKLKK
jgi:hypothetical protein